ncbi:acid-sensing ion channel 1C-like isoform X2 [Physella acuta]|uniref:acid-sensing ion channel 1C-like isoform X2 n=1 Tax=Physella acuta TaxID=109671 RepID=UPI0027DDCE53|nr:acid-sensing ion channel 1C-like isoform X2 [Physella acuta]
MSSRRPSSALDIVRQFADQTTAHGAKYTVTSENGRVWQTVWLATILTTCGYMSYQLVCLSFNYFQYPFQTVNRMTPMASLKFPAITICDLNHIDSTKIREYSAEVTEILSFISLIDEGSPSIEDSFVYCSWQGEGEDCQKLLSYAYTHSGRCFRLNQTVVDTKRSDNYGSRSGFFAVLKVNAEGYTVSDKHSLGFKLFIHHHYDYVDVNLKHILLSPGFSYDVSFQQYTLKYLPSPYNSLGRDCLAGSVGDLDPGHPAGYSFSQCVVERSKSITAAICGCNITDCTVKEFLDCYNPNFDVAYMNTSREGCLVPCSSHSYVPIISHAIFPAPHFAWTLKPTFWQSGDLNDSFTQAVVAVNLHFEDLILREVEHVPLFNMHSVMGIVGGNMGLFLGASLLTCVELLQLTYTLIKYGLLKLMASRRQPHVCQCQPVQKATVNPTGVQAKA